MRGSTGLLLCGAVAIMVATTAPVLAAEDAVTVVPASEAQAPADATADDALETPSVPADQAADPRPEPAAVEAEEVTVDEDRGDTRQGEGEKPKPEADPPKQPLAGANVSIKNFKFSPDPLRINAGDSVTWTNHDTAQHNAVDAGEFETDLLEKNESDTVKIGQPGTYNYTCTVHPDMKAELIAESGGGSGGSGTAGTGATGGTSTDSGGSNTTLGSGTSGSSSSGSSGSLPNTGQEQLPLLILGATLIVAGLLTRAFHEYWIWR